MKNYKFSENKIVLSLLLVLIVSGLGFVVEKSNLVKNLHVASLVSKIQPFFLLGKLPQEQEVSVAADEKSKPPMIEQLNDVTIQPSWRLGSAQTPPPAIVLNEKIIGYEVVEVDVHPEHYPQAGEQIQMPLLNGTIAEVNVESVTVNPNGDYSWAGHLQGYGTDYPVVMTYGEHSTFATVTTPEGSYSMESTNGVGWVYKNPAEVELSVPGSKDFLDVPVEH
jgi:hypothetical protein